MYKYSESCRMASVLIAAVNSIPHNTSIHLGLYSRLNQGHAAIIKFPVLRLSYLSSFTHVKARDHFKVKVDFSQKCSFEIKLKIKTRL